MACAVAAGWDGVRTEMVPLELEVSDGWLCKLCGQEFLPIIGDVKKWLDKRHNRIVNKITEALRNKEII